MCGIAGQLVFGRDIARENLLEITTKMVLQLAHRGPDDMGIWSDNASGIYLAHRRLSILDMSSEGHQPMASSSGRLTIVFNGEIYNHAELRQQLPGHAWRGHSDTEVMLAAVSQWGVLEAVRRFVGMFAFALWDKAERQLYLVRDRMGEKPLYYGNMAGHFIFGSELKALRAHPLWEAEVDRDALALYLKLNYIPAPFTIYQHIRKLEPGCIARIDGTRTDGHVETQRYWSFGDNAKTSRDGIMPARAVDQVEEALSQAIEGQMVADVPVGAFLSGGIDSSLIVALMQKQSAGKVRTFTVGFNESAFNEAEHAKAVAAHLGTSHTEFYVTPRDALDVIPLLPTLYDEPFADSSQIPTYLVARLTRAHVTVSLSGDGGDELFGGYNRYVWGGKLWAWIKLLPLPGRQAVARLIRVLSPQDWDRVFSFFNGAIPRRMRYNAPGDKLHKLARLLGARHASEVYFDLTSLWHGIEMVAGSRFISTIANDASRWPAGLGLPEFMMHADSQSYLPDDILTKVDRATMGVSLESRAPFLDHRVAELASSLPLDLKIREGQGKWILRQILYKHVPRELIERPKMGFAIPIDSWLRGPLRDWAETLLGEARLRSEGYFDPLPIRKKWEEHLSGQRNWQNELWGVLMFQAWRERWL